MADLQERAEALNDDLDNYNFSAVTIKTPNKRKDEDLPANPSTPPRPELLTKDKDRATDQKLADLTTTTLQAVTLVRFRLKMQHFERVTASSPEVAWAPEYDKELQWHPVLSMILLNDNVFHIQALIALLFERELIVKGKSGKPDYATIEIIMRRMLALISVEFGCIVEGSFLLSTTDSLLEDLACHVIGSRLRM